MTNSPALVYLVECVLHDILSNTVIVLLFIKHCLSISNNVIGCLGTKYVGTNIDTCKCVNAF